MEMFQMAATKTFAMLEPHLAHARTTLPIVDTVVLRIEATAPLVVQRAAHRFDSACTVADKVRVAARGRATEIACEVRGRAQKITETAVSLVERTGPMSGYDVSKEKIPRSLSLGQQWFVPKQFVAVPQWLGSLQSAAVSQCSDIWIAANSRFELNDKGTWVLQQAEGFKSRASDAAGRVWFLPQAEGMKSRASDAAGLAWLSKVTIAERARGTVAWALSQEQRGQVMTDFIGRMNGVKTFLEGWQVGGINGGTNGVH